MKTRFELRSRRWRLARNLGCIPALVLVATLLQPSPHLAAGGDVHGSLESYGSHTILNLWGTSYEMGYAHGYLLAREIMEMIEHFSYRGPSDYLFRMDEVSRRYRFAPRYEYELRGMLDGMRASGQDLYFDELHRDINLLDLKVWNSFLDFTAGCASLAVWGEASVDGQTIDARSFTHGLDEQRYFPRHTLLKTVDPGPPYLSNWLSVSWPGFIGAISGLNEHGVKVSANYGRNGQQNPGDDGVVAHGLIFRDALERSDAEDPIGDVYSLVASMQKRAPVIVHVSLPYYTGGVDPSVVLESDAYGTVLRTSDYDYPDYEHILAKNHFVEYETGIPAPDSSVNHYERMADLLIEKYYVEGDGKVDSWEAGQVLRALSGQVPGVNHIMVIRPAEATFDLSIALVVDTLEVTPAQFVEPEHYTWSQLFPNHEEPPPLPLEIIVDNQDAAFSTEGAWATLVTDRGYGEDVRYAIVKTPTGQTRVAAWAVDVPISHDYHVYAMWAQSQKHASDVPYEISHASGRDVVVMDQTRDGDLWNHLGTFSFEAGRADQSVAVTNLASTGTTVCADAVRLVPAD